MRRVRVRRLLFLLLTMVCLQTETYAQQNQAFLDRSNVDVTINQDGSITGNDPLHLTVKRVDHGISCSKVWEAKVMIEAVPQTIPQGPYASTTYDEFKSVYQTGGSFPAFIQISYYPGTGFIRLPAEKHSLCNINPNDVSPSPYAFQPLQTFGADVASNSKYLLLRPIEFCDALGWGNSFRKMYVVRTQWDDNTNGDTQFSMTISCAKNTFAVTAPAMHFTDVGFMRATGDTTVAVHPMLNGGSPCKCGTHLNHSVYADNCQSDHVVVKTHPALWVVPGQNSAPHDVQTAPAGDWSANGNCSDTAPSVQAQVVTQAEVENLCGEANAGKSVTRLRPISVEFWSHSKPSTLLGTASANVEVDVTCNNAQTPPSSAGPSPAFPWGKKWVPTFHSNRESGAVWTNGVTSFATRTQTGLAILGDTKGKTVASFRINNDATVDGATTDGCTFHGTYQAPASLLLLKETDMNPTCRALYGGEISVKISN